MGVEKEIKLRIEDVAGFWAKFQELDAKLLGPRHFEDNHVLDFPNELLRSLGSLLRVRTAGEAAYITYKGPPLPGGLFKVREELESSVQDGIVILRILEQLGLRVWFRYQKYREEHVIVVAGLPGEVRLAYDETPIGVFVELEGSEEGIREVANALGFPESQFLRDTYYHLYVQYCRERGESPGNMVFV